MSDDGPKVIDMSAAAKPAENSSQNEDEGPFCPFSWMLGHGQNPITKQVMPMPFANACLKERCAVYDAAGERCAIVSFAQRLVPVVEAPLSLVDPK